MNVDMYQKTAAVCQKAIENINEQNNRVIIFLDDDPLWHEEMRRKCKPSVKIQSISNTKEFKSFINHNGCSKMFIDINMVENGLDLAEELSLNDYFGELFFVSLSDPTPKDLKRIEDLGAKFVLKDDVVTKIIHPEEAHNGIHS